LTKSVEKVKISLLSCLTTEGLEDPRYDAKFFFTIFEQRNPRKRFATEMCSLVCFMFTLNCLHLPIIRDVRIHWPRQMTDSKMVSGRDLKIDKIFDFHTNLLRN
jgi:hypothetical protein